MKHWISIVALLAMAAFAQEKQMTTFNFDSDTAGQPPKGFEFALTGEGKPGKWVVQAVDDAPSGKDRKSTRLNSSHLVISYAVFCLKKKINSRHLASWNAFFFLEIDMLYPASTFWLYLAYHPESKTSVYVIT